MWQIHHILPEKTIHVKVFYYNSHVFFKNQQGCKVKVAKTTNG